MLLRLATSSIGKKLLVGLTGLILVGFILGHMIGNLLIFLGPDVINEYGHMLHTMGHGMAIWVARAVIFGSIILHVILTIQLTRQNRAARAERYGFEATQVASRSSRLMIISGLTLLAFFIYHILHFTVRVGTDFDSLRYNLNGVDVHNVYQMVINGFSVPAVSLFYIISMLFLCSHLSHGVASIPQTFGLNTEATGPLFKKIGYAFAALVLVGNCSIPAAIWLFGYGRS